MAITVETQLYIVAGVLGGACLILALCLLWLYLAHSETRSRLNQLTDGGKHRIQRVKMRADSTQSYGNPTIAPGEELARRGYSMYRGQDQDMEPNGNLSGPVFLEDVQEKASRGRNSPPPRFARPQNYDKGPQSSNFRNNLAMNGDSSKNFQRNGNFIY